MTQIADFLRAWYTERRALAEAASPGPWHANPEHDEVVAADGITVAEGFALSGRQLRATVDHIAANDPTVVIADCDAKLWIINVAEKLPELTAGFDQFDNNRDAWARTLKLFAQPFAGHPDHKGEEWAP
ncbi:DUF6221 family protein [Streptomyces sp. ID05-04B]|uniref:DUF6221 family protein n=1 Tax=Streptomyces sp. ID05-04B TaxID=3028661 RepID=UPI0029C35ED3|nr:DUF6221 family protein [Streptomyces sp. ID05-04B]MDX5563734.1 DUF6221 family protein [Streptomyces sp. ID05-04B]